MADLWVAEGTTRNLMEEVVAKWHPELADIDQRIAILMREPASKSGGVMVLGSTKKTSQREQLLGKKEWVFVLEIAAAEWVDLDSGQRTALMDHLLCACGVEHDEEKGTVKYFVRKPEIQMFKAEVRRHGVWMDISDEKDDGNQAVTTIESLFGETKDALQEVKASVQGFVDSLPEGTTATLISGEDSINFSSSDFATLRAASDSLRK